MCRVRSSLSPWKKEWDPPPPPPHMLWIHPIVWRKNNSYHLLFFPRNFWLKSFCYLITDMATTLSLL
jgi:hypothetical protein